MAKKNKKKEFKTLKVPHIDPRTGEFKRKKCGSVWEEKNGKLELDKTEFAEKIKIDIVTDPIETDTDEFGNTLLTCGAMSTPECPRGYFVGDQWCGNPLHAFSLSAYLGLPIEIYDGNEDR